jgi:hypothetical protein
MKRHGLESIVDIGCGSAYKLLTYLGDYETIGMEVPANVEALRRSFPERRWEVSEFSVKPDIRADVVICADVVEHLVDPDELLHYVKNIEHEYLVLSTPDRGLLYKPWQRGFFGPPTNQTHVREWTFREFHEYISLHFHIIDHRVTNLRQCTQMVTCARQ